MVKKLSKDDSDTFSRVEQIKKDDAHYASGEGTGPNTNKDLGKTKTHWTTGNSNLGDQTYPGFSRFFMRLAEKEQLQQSPSHYIFTGFVPEQPFIKKSHNITALGSCFAQEITKYLSTRAFNINNQTDEKQGNIDLYFYGFGLMNSFAIREQFEFAYENKEVSADMWDFEGTNIKPSEELRQNLKKTFDETDVFIITYGMSEVWWNKKTNSAAWRKVNEKNTQFESDDFEYKISTCAENIENIEKIYSLIRKHRPDASIIMTLSPVGIRATWREVGSVVANTVSKATLRVALDEVHRKHSVVDKKFFYLPSYEIVREFGSVSETYKSFQDNFRHPPTDTVLLIMEFFRKYFVVKE